MNYKLTLLFVLLGTYSSTSEEISVAEGDTGDIFAEATRGLVKILNQAVASVAYLKKYTLRNVKSTATAYVKHLEYHRQGVRKTAERLSEGYKGNIRTLNSTVNNSFNTVSKTVQYDFHRGVQRFSDAFGPVVEFMPELKPEFLSTKKELIRKENEVYDQINKACKGFTQELENERASTLAALKF